MALDTAARRKSALLEPGEMPAVPDGLAFDVYDRAAMLEFYSGLETSDGLPNYIRGTFASGRSVFGGKFSGRSAFGGQMSGKIGFDGKFRSN